MKPFLPLFCFLFAFVLGQSDLKAQDMTLTYQSTYATGVFDEGAAEIVAFDKANARLFFTNANANKVTVLDISNPQNPVFVQDIELSSYGAGVNSVAVFENIVAVAVEADPKQGPGSVVFFDTDGNFLNSVTVGALPDMVAFTHDGTKVLSANEGEPDDDYLVDPEGSVSIIDIGGGVASAIVTNVTFGDYNDKKASLQNKGVRIFGPDASVAQDLEPEYLTITPDNSRAYVGLQENNALAVINIAEGTVEDILPLGYKDHMSGTPTLREFKLNELVDLPALGVPVIDGVEQDTVFLSGFSGLYFDANESTDTKYVFYAIPDRGPNEGAVSADNVFSPDSPDLEPFTNLRPFKLPDYQARIARFEIDVENGTATLADQIFLNRVDDFDEAKPITGRGNVISFDETPVRISKIYSDTTTVFTDADYVDTTGTTWMGYRELQFDTYGGDFEGILRDENGNFWMCDEYRPSIYQFSPEGTLIKRLVPEGTGELTVEALGFAFSGAYGEEVLPEVYSKRRANRGFEAIAYDQEAGIVYAFIQSPVETPDRATIRNNSDVIRILGVNVAEGTVASEYVYLLERNRDAGIGNRVDKIGDAVYIGNGKFLILERDSSQPGDDTGQKYVYEIDITPATNLRADANLTALADKAESTGADDKTLEMMTADDLAAAGIRPAFKRKVVNLPTLGYQPSDKAEGIALLPDGSIAVLNDNDFGTAGAGRSDISSLGIISFDDHYGFDASDSDEGINITNHPTLGMFQPDALASFSINGKSYIVSANEGDARDYDGFSEEVRVFDLPLSIMDFPNFVDIFEDSNLGRLRTTSANGNLDGEFGFNRLFSYGARSFSIWDEVGNLVYDSGDELERVTAEYENGLYFNSNNDDNDSFDSRSDDKGPEPEAVELGMMGDIMYGFIGLERVGGIMVYNMSDPLNPQFVSYINNRNFAFDAESAEALDLGVEDIVFISAEDSPVAVPLVVTSNEVSGTVSIFSIGEFTDVEDIDQDVAKALRVYPNPVAGSLFTNQVSDFQVISSLGQVLLTQQNTQEIDLTNLPAGTYFLRDVKHNQSKVFIKN
jgi:hypothetical protein